jgi:hypothetical protein
MTILDIGKFLKDFFNTLKINVYPLIAENSAPLPFAIYQRSATEHNHKDQQINQATYNITIISEQYNESIGLLQKVIDECRNIHEYQGTAIRINIDSTDESYSDNYI